VKRWLWWCGSIFVVALLGVWLARNTYWDDVMIPTPPKGEALTNPFYAVQRFAEQLGARTSYDLVLAIPPPNSIVVLSDWHWDLSASRRVALEKWVASGGRLVIEDGVMGDETAFEQWSGIVREYQKEDEEEKEGESTYTAEAGPFRSPCQKFREQRREEALSDRQYWLCGFDSYSWFSSERPVTWAVRNEVGAQVLRVAVGQGSVTIINSSAFRYRGIFEGEHGRLFVAATELQPGDTIHFLSEEEHRKLLSLVWLYGRPVVVLAGVLLGLALWRNAIRLGPLAAVPARARRSLAEQIRGTGQFALRQGGGEALHAACVRALEEAAERRVSGWHRLGAMDRASQLAKLTGFDRDALAAAIYHPALRRSAELRSTIGLLESARRIVLVSRSEEKRSSHGTA
jgi:hypothetical protein